MSELLPLADFLTGVRLLPLVSIDLIVRDAEGRMLVGERVRRPAQGSWFVPGGCVRKNERLADAFRRITRAELGEARERTEARFVGVFEHHYHDNAGTEAFSTHYVVLAHELDWPRESSLPAEQHSGWRWLSDAELLRDPLVHPNTRAYAAASE